MGWSNFIIITKWKMIIETNRNVGELEDYIKGSIDGMIDCNADIDIDISDLKVGDITIKDLCTLASVYDNAITLAGMDTDKLFLFWLESRDIGYDIRSEYNVDLEEYKNNGYTIIRIWDDKHDKNDKDDKDDKNGDNNIERQII